MKLAISTELSKEDQIELGRMLARNLADQRDSDSRVGDYVAGRQVQSIAWLARNNGIAASRPDVRKSAEPKTLDL